MRVLAIALRVGLLLGCGCGPSQSVRAPDAGTCPVPPPDSDHDGIGDFDEGAYEKPPRDTDHDGMPDYLDLDSDGDGIPDAIEGRNGAPCFPPVDSDGDGKPDFQDLDSDSATDDTVPDQEEAGAVATMPVDTNQDGRPDYMDPDDDGDTIPDRAELTATAAAAPARTRAAAPDTNHDGVPDYLDRDSDGDTIFDVYEGNVDTNRNGVPNYRDLDSDGDCISDQREAHLAMPGGPPLDTNKDGVPDFEDLDSDGDGLVDRLEDTNCNGVLDPCEYDRLKPDTAGNGIGDLIEYADCRAKPAAVQSALMCQCWGTSPATSPLTIGDFVFVADYLKPPKPALDTLAFATDVQQADVIFMIDSTLSMDRAHANLAASLSSTVIPQVRARLPNVAFGLLDFKDFGDAYVVQYDHKIETVTTAAGVASIQAAVNALTASGGGDPPEAGWEALYAIAGGAPLFVASPPAPSGYSSVLPLMTAPPTPPVPGEMQGALYGAGFRSGSMPIVVTVSDAEWHDAPNILIAGENGRNDYGPGSGCPTGCDAAPSRQLAIQQVNAMGGHVIAIAGAVGTGATTGNPKARGIGTAQATSAVVAPLDFGSGAARPAGCSATQCCTGLNGAGESDTPPGSGLCPLSFTYDDSTGNGVSTGVVTGIVALASSLKFDIHVQAVDVDPNTVDNFVARLVPNLSGTGPASVCITVPPQPLQDNFSGPHALAGTDGVLDTFPQVAGSKHICFDVVPKTNLVVMETAQPQLFHARLVVKGVARGQSFDLGTPRDIFFLVPPLILNGPIQ